MLRRKGGFRCQYCNSYREDDQQTIPLFKIVGLPFGSSSPSSVKAFRRQEVRRQEAGSGDRNSGTIRGMRSTQLKAHHTRPHPAFQ